MQVPAVYVGRIAAIGRSREGRNAVLYRVSSRSFPNRRAVEQDGAVSILPRAGHEADLVKSPYIAYRCLRLAGEWAVASNGSHTDALAEKLESGVPPRDALANVLLAFDYEKDDLSTPRIAAMVPREGERGWLAIVRRDALVVKEVALEAGRARYIATYEADDVRDAHGVPFDAASAQQAALAVISGPGFAAFERPVTSAAALVQPTGFALGTYSV
jgi:IMP cyclohydrolase